MVENGNIGCNKRDPKIYVEKNYECNRTVNFGLIVVLEALTGRAQIGEMSIGVSPMSVPNVTIIFYIWL